MPPQTTSGVHVATALRISPRRIAARAAWAVAVALAPAVAHAQATAPLAWTTGDVADQPNQRIALVVTAQVAGRPCQMQLDTGFNDAVRWQPDIPAGKKPVVVTVTFAGLSVNVATSPEVASQLGKCVPGATAGSLGNAFFEAGSLTLDLKSARMRYVAGPTLAARLDAQPMFYARWTAQGGRPLVEVRKDGVLRGYALLDTGSAGTGFGALSKAQWDATTASAPLAATAAVHAFVETASGRSVACFSAASAAPVQAGTWALGTLPVTYCPKLDLDPPLKLEGVLGLRGFAESIITIDYVSGRWLVEKPH